MAPQRTALAAARLFRAEMLMEVFHEVLDPEDVINEARLPSNQSLRQIALKELLLNSGMSEQGWRRVRTRMVDALGRDYPQRDLTIGWLLDPRAGGRRHYAFRDALRSRTEPPWPGFPWASPSA